MKLGHDPLCVGPGCACIMPLQVLAERDDYRERGFDPTLRRDPHHFPEPLIGGACYWVQYHVHSHIGFVVTRWNSIDGVHWEAITDNFHVISLDGARPAAYDHHWEAANQLLARIGFAPDWKPKRTSPEWKTKHTQPKGTTT